MDDQTRCHYQKITHQERDALIALYNSTNGSGWNDNTNWGVGDPCNDGWYGVTCNSDGHIVTLNLASNNLRGNLPDAIGDLSALQTVWAWSNEINGSIPASIGDLGALQDFELNDNKLSGSIPSELGNDTNLTCLSLGNNDLSGAMPESIGNLSKLYWLEPYGNQLSGAIPDSFGNMGALEYAMVGFAGKSATRSNPRYHYEPDRVTVALPGEQLYALIKRPGGSGFH